MAQNPDPLIGSLVAVADRAVADRAFGNRFVETSDIGAFSDDAGFEQDKPRLDYFPAGRRGETSPSRFNSVMLAPII